MPEVLRSRVPCRVSEVGLLAGFPGSLGAVTNRGCYLLPSTVHDILMQQPSTLQDDQGLKLCWEKT